MTGTEEALRAASTRLGLTPQVERATREALNAVLSSGYDHRPQEESDLSPEQYRAQLADEAVVAVFTYTALHLSGQYGRAAAHLLHALNRSTPSRAGAQAPSGPPSRPSTNSDPAHDDARLATLDQATRLHLRDLAGTVIARQATWQLAVISGDEQRLAAARTAALPAIRRLLDAQLDARLITTEQHEQRVRALETDDSTLDVE
ncbi:hypothetical protein [Kitasatospora brasiliensis]|uniref:hypothetical protein n=1 Tax=Kitasatospora brasiliensis TaxID=3058040 RepID=UPI002930DEFA|nr:hypothetical protein [Kitasatospora sp. K002]